MKDGSPTDPVLAGGPPPSGETWFLLQSGPGWPALNMAIDEALLEAAPRLRRPALRFYGWTEPAATFGYFQRHAEVCTWTSLRPLIRRPTGGGIVPHDRDWTYTLVFPPEHGWYGLPARASYTRVHTWIQRAFERLDLPAELASQAQPSAGRCFAGAELDDLLWSGAKIAGAAQRRTRTGLLIQGSVQPPAGAADRMRWESALCAVAAEGWGVRWQSMALDGELAAHADRLAREKYGHAEYLMRR